MGIDITTLVIIGITVLISLQGFQKRLFFDRYKFQIAPIKSGDYIRLMSSGFLHVDYTHLFFNMFGLFMFAAPLIRQFGQIKFVILYLASMLAGSLLSFVYHKNKPYYSAVGASGAVSGVLFAYILLNPFHKLYFIFLPVIGISAIVIGIGYLLYSVYGMKKSLGNIGHAAHLGGATMGLLMSVIYKPELLTESTYIILILCVPLLLLFVSSCKTT